MTTAPPLPLQPGERAPDFSLPAIHRDGTVSSSDYLGKRPLLVALFRGLWCPFCRRAIAQLGTAREKLDAVGVDTLAIVATPLENARLYFRYRPTKVALAADPDLTTHRAFRLPRPEITPELMQGIQVTKANPTGELPAPLPLVEAADALDRLHGFSPTAVDLADKERQFPQLKGQFLLDRAGIVRWVNVECARDGLEGLGKFPTDDELVAAARGLHA